MNKSKSLVIKTASNVIYVVNGKVSCVRCATTGRFVAVKKFANIINSLIVKAKNVDAVLSSNNEFYYNSMTKLAMRNFKNMAKMATALLGEVRVFTSRNYCHDSFNFTTLGLYA